MLFIEALFLIAAIATITFTARVAYIIKDDSRRKQALEKHEAEHGQQAYEMYQRIYTKQTVYGGMLFGLSWVLFIVQDVMKLALGRHNVAALAVGVVAMVSGIAGASIASRAMRLR